jgi:hypothetical protein
MVAGMVAGTVVVVVMVVAAVAVGNTIDLLCSTSYRGLGFEDLLRLFEPVAGQL